MIFVIKHLVILAVPEAPEPEAIYICECCGDGIYAGDGYYDFLDGAWCEECVREQYRIAEGEYLEGV